MSRVNQAQAAEFMHYEKLVRWETKSPFLNPIYGEAFAANLLVISKCHRMAF